MYASVDMQHYFKACVAGIMGDEVERYKHECGVSVASAKRLDAAKRALEAVIDERGGGRGTEGDERDESVAIPDVLRRLMMNASPPRHRLQDAHNAHAPAPCPPNYIIQCNDIDLWVSESEDEDEKEDDEIVSPPQISISSLTETISIQPPLYTAILPVLQEYQHITLQSAHLPIGFILKDRVPLTVLRRHREAIEALCYEIKEVGGFWNEANGLRLDPAGYRKARRYRHDVPSGAVDMYDLCESVVRNVCAMEDMFYDAVYAVAHGLTRSSRSVFLMLLTDMAKSFPPTSNDTKQQRSDPLPVAWLASFRETVEMNGVAYMTRDLARDLGKLNKTLQITLGEVNLLLHIAATYFSQPTTWWHLLRQSHSPQLEPIGQIHANLTLIATKGSSIITTQTAVLEQEDSFLL
ncbi:hypothetical protein ACHAPI_011475 [Fusarium lateritium]